MRTLLAPAILSAVLCSFAQGPPSGERKRVSSPIAFYDDADPAAPGTLQVSTTFSYTDLSVGGDRGLPSVDFGLGLSKRLEISGSSGYARSRFERLETDGRSDTYLGLKYLLVPEGRRRPALAIEPMLEILGDPSIVNNLLAPDRVNCVLPLILQKSFDYYRIYGMAGYLTRGIAYSSAVFELNRWARVTPVAIVSGSRVTRELGLISELGLNRSRVDGVGGIVVAIRPGLSVYVNGGRSLGRLDVNSSRYQVAAGIGFTVRLWGKK